MVAVKNDDTRLAKYKAIGSALDDAKPVSKDVFFAAPKKICRQGIFCGKMFKMCDDAKEIYEK